MTPPPDNPQAFPMPAVLPNGISPGFDGATGMTLRDYFAAAGISGVLSTASNLGDASAQDRRLVFYKTAAILYEFADAMLSARERSGKE